MAKQLWQHGTGNYPNNVVNYLLNSSPMYCVKIPDASKELRLLWNSVTEKLPKFVVSVVEFVFDERWTLKIAARRVGASPTTVRRIVRRLYSWVNKDGYSMQALFNWATEKGYVTTITADSVKEAHRLYMNVDDISAWDAAQFYTLLSNGYTLHDAHKTLGVRMGILIRLYNKAVEVQRKMDSGGK